MIVDQADTLRTMMKQASAAAEQVRASPPEEPAALGVRAIAIASGKGGVGKSNLAVNLAVQLRRMQRRVLLIDADLGTANADLLCGLSPSVTLAHVVAGKRAIEQAVVDGPAGLRLLPGASGLGAVAAMSEDERRRLIQQFRRIEHEIDVVLIDTGAGISPNVLSFLACVDQTLVVTTPETTAVTDAYALIKTAARKLEQPDLDLVVNMARDEREAQDTYNRLAKVSAHFLGLTLGYAGFIPRHPCVTQAVQRRQPFVVGSPHSAAARRISELAHRLDRFAAEPRPSGLIERLTRWFTRSAAASRASAPQSAGRSADGGRSATNASAVHGA